MFESDRRKFLLHTGLGLAGTAGSILRSDAQPTPQIAVAEEANRILIQMAPPPKVEIGVKGELKKITPQPYGPFYKQGAPFRGKLCEPAEPGTTFVLQDASGPSTQNAHFQASFLISGMWICRRSIQTVSAIFAIVAG